ncbi:MAG: hypothetical protein K2Q22_05915, partial [Cytophagales bacterium]|nr:hypothetical protein [Cytophagales bacterium]
LDGSVYTVPDSVALKVQETDVYQIANIPVGNYKSVRFNVGLNPATSAKPSSAYANGVLNRSDMWYGTTAQPNGYIFLNLEGKIDTTSDLSAADAQMQPFSYKLGGSTAYKPVTLPDKNFSITLNQTQYVHLIADWNVLLSGIQFNNPSNLSIATSSASSSALATSIANNIPNMFRYEE